MIAATYSEARSLFLNAAAGQGAVVTHVEHPSKGPAGEALAVDIARLGALGSDRVVVVISGVHGVEGFAGSALQTDWMNTLDRGTLADTEVVLIHAVNPFGFAWTRRVTEDNVDLNRNFVDFPAVPENAEYDALADALVPTEWTEVVQNDSFLVLLEALERLGASEMAHAVTGGQYRHPRGVFYGGTEPTWSRSALEATCRQVFQDRTEIVVVDLHTGLGEWAHGELICAHSTESAEYARAVKRFGDDVSSLASGSSISAVLLGEWLVHVDEWAAQTPLIAVGLEFGTIDEISVLNALRADAWLHSYGDPTGPEAAAIKADLRAAFVDEGDEWFNAVQIRFRQVLDRAITRQ